MKGEIETISPLDTSFSYRNASYNRSLSTCASTLSSSAWSDASQASTDTSISTSSQPINCDSVASSAKPERVVKLSSPWPKPNQPRLAVDVVAPELRQNPRRTSQGAVSRSGCPPRLVHQNDRKVNFVDNLVDSAALIVEAIWPLSSAPCRNDTGGKAVLPLRSFIQETLKRSRTSYSTLQVTMYYLILIKDHVPKHDLTMEQPNDLYENRALQCGRRVFLAALILASKYLQDRNYSARAWSKISGLNTNEINQNEMAFLLAVNWNLHITDPIWQRWTKILLNYRPPPSPPSPGFGLARFCSQSHDWKRAILKLGAELTNVDDLLPFARCNSHALQDIGTGPSAGLGFDANELPPLTPTVMEPPTPTSVHTPGRLVPALGLLPTPKLTPQTSGFCTPAASAGPQLLGKSSAMCLAMAQAGNANATQFLDRLPGLPGPVLSTSPQSYFTTRRSSLANSISTASSPESMVSDISRSSRASSISSASSLASATMQSRYRAAKLGGDRPTLRPIIASVPEDFAETCFTSSPESYAAGPVGKLGDLSLDTPLTRHQPSLEDLTRDPVSDAARTLSELHSQHCSPMSNTATTPVAKIGTKRSRTSLAENPLQESVRDILAGRSASGEPAWPETFVRSKTVAAPSHGVYLQVPTAQGWHSNKRLCCSTEASADVGPSLMHPSMAFGGFGRPGMWDGILHD